MEKTKNQLQALLLGARRQCALLIHISSIMLLFAEFTQLQEKKQLDEASTAARVATIESLKEKLRLENEELKVVRQQLKQLLAQQQNEKQPNPLSQTIGWSTLF